MPLAYEEQTMLLRFEVGNHRSICEPVELSMIAMDKDRAAARQIEDFDERVLTVAGISALTAPARPTSSTRSRGYRMRSDGRYEIGRTRSPVIRSASLLGHRSRRTSG